MMSIRKVAAGAFVLAAAVSACGGNEPSACDQLDELNRSGDYEALAADAEDPNGALNGCMEEAGELWEDMTPEERESFLYGD